MPLRAKRSSPPAVRAPLLLLVHFDSRGWATTRLLRGEAATLVEHYAPQAGNVEQDSPPEAVLQSLDRSGLRAGGGDRVARPSAVNGAFEGDVADGVYVAVTGLW